VTGLPRSFSATRTTNPTNSPPLPTRMFITNASIVFVPEDSLITDVYSVLISVTMTSTLTGAAGALTTQEGFQVNTTASGFGGGGVSTTLTSGSPGTGFTSQNYSEAENDFSYPPTDSYIELKVNRIFANELFTKRIVMPPPCGCWMVNAGKSDLKFDNTYPIFCSLKNAGKKDDQFILGPGYRIVFFMPITSSSLALDRGRDRPTTRRRPERSTTQMDEP
jgi:hypothetical protein